MALGLPLLVYLWLPSGKVPDWAIGRTYLPYFSNFSVQHCLGFHQTLTSEPQAKHSR